MSSTKLVSLFVCISAKFRYLSLSKCEIETVGKRFGRHAVWIQHQTIPVSVDIIHLIITSTLNTEHLFNLCYLDQIFLGLVFSVTKSWNLLVEEKSQKEIFKPQFFVILYPGKPLLVLDFRQQSLSSGHQVLLSICQLFNLHILVIVTFSICLDCVDAFESRQFCIFDWVLWAHLIKSRANYYPGHVWWKVGEIMNWMKGL